MEANTKDNTITNKWYTIAFSTAFVGTVFSAIVLVLLVVNLVHTVIVQAAREKELADMKIEVQNVEDKEQFLSQIRQQDLIYRQKWFGSQDFNRMGSYLLLGGVLVMLAGFKIAGNISKPMPLPQKAPDRLTEQARNAKFSRWAIISGLVGVAFGVLLLASIPGIPFFLEKIATNVFDPSEEEIAANWPRFRGPGGLGISTYENVPEKWDGKSGEGILWKTAVPLPGMNSPVVWGDKVFLAGGDANELAVFCFDADSGSQLWKGQVTHNLTADKLDEPFYAPSDTGFSAPTVATDGKHVYAIFLTGTVACFDFDGNKVWQEDLGLPETHYGYATSLATYNHLLLIQVDQGRIEENKSEIIAFDGDTGKVAWRKKRPVESSWSTPIVVKIDGQYQFVTCSYSLVISYNPANGSELWRAKGLTGEIASSPIYAGEMIIAINPPGKMMAIRPDGSGDVTETHIAWNINCDAPEICSPVGNEKFIFLIDDTYLICHQTSDGKKLWEYNLKEYFSASPSLVGNKLYLLSEEGSMFIIEAARQYKEPIISELGEKCLASPAFMDGRIYIRSEKNNLYCIGTKL